MSDTPRTDEVAFKLTKAKFKALQYSESDQSIVTFVSAGFARRLERELAEVKQRSAEWAGLCGIKDGQIAALEAKHADAPDWKALYENECKGWRYKFRDRAALDAFLASERAK